MTPQPPRDPVEDLRRIAYLLERVREPTYRVRAFRTAAGVVADLPRAEVQRRSREQTLQELAGIGEVTARCITESLAGEEPSYLRRLEDEAAPLVPEQAALRALIRGDCHTHSDWSDGGSPIAEMARAAAALGHDWCALTDHSPRLTVARGLTAERLREQLGVVAQVNEELAPFRLLTGIEVDINEDGSLDQEPELLRQLDVVVASVHSKLRMPAPEMTARMVKAVASGQVDVLGHCTGRIVVGRGRPESTFDAELVFAACARFDVAVEVNSRPERLDPPRRLLGIALDLGCRVAVDTDAHAPGQLEWQDYGCARAEECGVPADRVVTAWPLERLLEWTGRRRS